MGGKAAASCLKGKLNFCERQSAAAGAVAGLPSQEVGAKRSGYRSINHLQKRRKERGVSAAGAGGRDHQNLRNHVSHAKSGGLRLQQYYLSEKAQDHEQPHRHSDALQRGTTGCPDELPNQYTSLSNAFLEVNGGPGLKKDSGASVANDLRNQGEREHKRTIQRRRTAQPNQRQKMIEQIRDAKEKEEQRLRQTFMSFYRKN